MDSRSPSGQQLPSTHSDLSILSLKQLHDFYTAALRLLEIEISSPLTACNICGGIGLALLALFGSVSIVFSSIPLIKTCFSIIIFFFQYQVYLRFIAWFQRFRNSHHTTGEALANLSRHFSMLLSSARHQAQSAPFILPMGPLPSARFLEQSIPGQITLSDDAPRLPSLLWSTPRLSLPSTPLSRTWGRAPGSSTRHFSPRAHQSHLPVAERTRRTHSLLDL